MSAARNLVTLSFAGWFLLPVPISAQFLNGFVRDSLGEPIVFANVVLSGCPPEKIFSYTQTNDAGEYWLALPAGCDTFYLSVHALGYSVREIVVQRKTPSPAVNFVLNPSNITLREVVVRSESPPVVVQGDTTEYNVASFADSTEFSVEDLLRKLPGAQVSENGHITLNGKSVERVLIEGDDLFSQNYQLATRNIRADMIAKVQAIDHFQENPLLKGLQASDRLILNLKIKAEKKRANSGSVMSGAGYGDDWKSITHLNFFSLSRKDKLYLIGNANNTNENTLRDMEWINRGDYADPGKQSLQDNPMQLAPVYRPATYESAGLPAPFTLSSQSAFLFAGYVLPVRQGCKWKITGLAGRAGLQQATTRTSSFLLNNDFMELTEDYKLNRDQSTGRVQVVGEFFSVNQKHALRTFFTLDALPATQEAGWLRNSLGFVQPIMGQTRERPSNGYLALEYTWKTPLNTAVQMNAKASSYRNQVDFLSQYDAYPAFFGVDSAFYRLWQPSGQRVRFASFTVRYLTRPTVVQWQIEAGIQAQSEQFFTELSLREANGDGQIVLEAPYRNDFLRNWIQPFVSGGGSRDFGPVHLAVRFGLYTLQQWLRDYTDGMQSSSRAGWLEPRLEARYKPDGISLFSASIAFRKAIPQLTDLYPNFFFTDYQQTVRGLESPFPSAHYRFALNYRFDDRLKQFSWYLGGRIDKGLREFGTIFQVDSNLFVQERFRPIQSDQHSLNAGGSRYVPSISSRFDAGLSFTGLWRADFINSTQPRRLNNQITTASFSYGTAFDGWLNGILSQQFVWLVSENRQAEKSTYLKAHNRLLSLQWIVKTTSHFRFQLRIYRAVSHGKGRPAAVFYASEASAQWRLPRWRSQVQLRGMNLLNTRNYTMSYADGFTQSTSIVSAVRPFLLFTWDFAF